jgi:uncharacterized protein YndB with AHSA1/START domain
VTMSGPVERTSHTAGAARSSEDLALSAERWVPFPVGRVWEKCTTKEGLERWWSPDDLRTVVKRLDARPGGEVVLTLRYAPALLAPRHETSFRAAGVPLSFSLRGRVRELERNRRLVLELTLPLDRTGSGIDTVTEMDFSERGTGTLVRLSVHGKSDPHFATLGQANLDGQLERLGRALDADSESTG